MRKLLLVSAFMLLLLLPGAGVAQQVTPGPPPPSPHPGHVVNYWYSPVFYQPASAGLAAPGVNTIVCSFGAIMQNITLSALGGRITTLHAGGNVQFALYNTGSWGRPSTLVAATASITTASAAAVNGTVSPSVPAGNYWFCENTDDATVTLTAQSSASSFIASPFVGAAAQGSAGTGPATNVTGITLAAQAFGTWPAFASNAAWTEITSNIAPYIVYKVGSVP